MDEITVTPEMIEAGCAELAICEPCDPAWSTAKAVYLAMERARIGQIVPAAERVPLCPGVTVDAGTIFVGTRVRDPRDTLSFKIESD